MGRPNYIHLSLKRLVSHGYRRTKTDDYMGIVVILVFAVLAAKFLWWVSGMEGP